MVAELLAVATVFMVLRTGHIEKTLYKIEFWVYEKILPGFEEISTHRIQEN